VIDTDAANRTDLKDFRPAQAGGVFVLGRESGVAACEGPIDTNFRIIPQNRSFTGRMPKGVDFIKNFGNIAQCNEPVTEPRRNPGLLTIRF
jgi:hypothetical protein